MNLTDVEIKQELANSITHFFGFLFGIVCIPILIAYSSFLDDKAAIVGASVFGFSFLMVYGFSTIYHSVSHPKVKQVMKTLDHISIYFMIAGSYTPFILLYFFNTPGIILLSVLWGLTFFGIIFKVFFINRFKLLSTFIYVAMGWLIVFFPIDMSVFPFETLVMIAAGGVSYSIGVVFYLWEKYIYNHAIWHIFVLGGSVCHYVAVLLAINGSFLN